MAAPIYTEEQLNIELLKQKDSYFHHLLTEIKEDIRELRNYMVGICMFGLGALVAVVSKAFGWV